MKQEELFKQITRDLIAGEAFILGTHISFFRLPVNANRITNVWNVCEGRDPSRILGSIQWFARWRKYCFFPAANTVFEETCTTEITHFFTEANRLHKEARSERKEHELQA